MYLKHIIAPHAETIGGGKERSDMVILVPSQLSFTFYTFYFNI